MGGPPRQGHPPPPRATHPGEAEACEGQGRSAGEAGQQGPEPGARGGLRGHPRSPWGHPVRKPVERGAGGSQVPALPRALLLAWPFGETIGGLGWRLALGAVRVPHAAELLRPVEREGGHRARRRRAAVRRRAREAGHSAGAAVVEEAAVADEAAESLRSRPTLRANCLLWHPSASPPHPAPSWPAAVGYSTPTAVSQPEENCALDA